MTEAPAVVDAHMHLWAIPTNPWYAHLQPFAEQVGAPHLYADFTYPDYAAAAQGVRPEALVHVSATTTPGTFLEEARWIDEVADAAGLNLVTVGTIDPDSDADRVVADLERQATSPRFRGIRVFPALDTAHPAVPVVLDWLAEHDHVFDLVCDPSSAADWLALLARYPDLRVAVEHTGSPDLLSADGFAAWSEALTALSRRPGLACKLTGLGMLSGALDAERLRPWIDRTFAVMGPDRVLFGSNMPIESMAGSFADWIEITLAAAGGLSAAEADRFLAGNARDLYRIDA